jgi:small subunit ribosomal protein S20
MAHSLSSRKRVRQNEKQRARNRARRSALKTRLKDAAEQLLHGSPEVLAESARKAIQSLDRAASRRTIHKNAAARTKSRLMKKLNAKQVSASR